MHRRQVLTSLSALTLAACAAPPVPQMGPDGKPLPQIYHINPKDGPAIEYRMLDGINSLRQAGNLPPVQFNALLTSAAATHSRDMAIQNRPWHFGSDGSSPIDRVRRAGYGGTLLGENISETYETELETLSAWMGVASTRSVILDPKAQEIGFAWFQEPSGKIWWTLVVATPEVIPGQG